MTQTHQSGNGVIKVKLLRAGRVLRSYKVQSDTFTIGTAPGSTIRAAGDPSVKPTHATLYIDEGEITLVPEPEAVVLLNGEQVDFAVPSPSDLIKIGKLTLQVELAGTIDSIPPSKPAATAQSVPPVKPSAGPPVRPTHSTPPSPRSSAKAAPPKSSVPPPIKPSAPPKSGNTVPPLHKPSAGVTAAQKPPWKRTHSYQPETELSSPAGSRSKQAVPSEEAPRDRLHRTQMGFAQKMVNPQPAQPLPSQPVQPSAPMPSAPQRQPAPQPVLTADQLSPFPDQTLTSDLPLFEEDEISANFDFEAKTRHFEKPDSYDSPSKLDERGGLPDPSVLSKTEPNTVVSSPPVTPTAPLPETAPAPLVEESVQVSPSMAPGSGFADVDLDYFFGEEDEESFVEPFSLADSLLSQRRKLPTESEGPKEPYCVAHVIRVMNDMVVDAFGVQPESPYAAVDGELKCYIVENKAAKSSQLILETGPSISGELHINGERRILDGTPTFKTELKEGDSALLTGSGGTYRLEVYRPPLAPKKGQMFSMSLPMMAVVLVLAFAFHGAAAYALRYVELNRIGDISKEEEEVFAEVIMEQPDKPKPEQKIKEEVAQDAKAIAERAPKVSQRTIKRRIKSAGNAATKKKQVSSLLNVLSRGSGAAGKSNNLKDLISNIDAVKSKGGSSGFSIAGAIASLPGKGVNIARSGGGGAISTLSGDQVAGKGSKLASLGKGKRSGKVRGKVTKMSSGAKIGGSLTREQVLQVINRHIHAIQACYERALMGNPALSGRISMDWTVAASGRVKSVRVRSSTIGSPKVASCISGVIKRWKFPRPKGGDARITFPFLFRSGS